MAHPSSGLSVAHDKAERPSPHGGSEGICALLSARWSEHRACYETTWQREDIHHMIDTLQELRSCLLSVPTNPQNSFSDLRSLQNGVDGSLTLQQCEYELARAHNDCYAQTGDIDELNKGMAILSALLSHLDASTDDTVIFQRLLGSLYRNRFGATKDKEDVRAALDLLSSTLSKCPSEHPERACTLFELGLAEHANNLSQHCAEDVNRSISYLDEALSLGDAKHAWQPICRDGLATALQYRYFMSEQLCDLEAAIKHLRQTLTELPLHHRDRWMAENHLGLALVLVYRHSGQESKLIDSLVYLRSAVACASKMNHAVAQPRCVTNLSAALFLRWQHQADVEALHEAIQLLRNTRPLSGVANWAHAINFASFLVERFDVLGEEDDLDEGIIILRQCISLAILRGEDRLSYHTEQLNLVQALRLRYELHGSQDDLSSARALCHEMVVHPTLNSMSRLHSIGSMAELLSYAYMRTKQNALLSDAEEFGRQWVDANGLNLDHFHYDIGLSDVAQVFMQCYKARRLMADLDQSIELWEKSVELRSQAGRPGLRESLIGLANGLLERYSTLKAVEDAARAKALLLEALRFAKSTGGDVVLPHLEVARMHLTRNSPNFDLSAALHHFAQALDNVHHHFSQCLRNAVELLKRFEDELFLHPYESAQHTEALLINYSRTIELLPRVAYLGLDESIRLNALSGDVNQLSSTAAVRAGCLGKLETAVELLEQGRAVFWVHRLQLRVPVKDLPPNLAERITVVATRLEQQQPIRLQMERSIEATQRLAESHFIKQRQLSREFEQLVDQVRQQPSFERFLLPAPFSVLSMAAVKNPVLILVTGNERAIGILLTCPHLTPQRLDFPGLALSKVRELSLQLVGASKRRRMSVRERAFKISQRNRSYDMEDILGVLWNSVAKVVIRALRLEVCKLKSCPHMLTIDLAHIRHSVLETSRKLPTSPLDLRYRPLLPATDPRSQRLQPSTLSGRIFERLLRGIVHTHNFGAPESTKPAICRSDQGSTNPPCSSILTGGWLASPCMCRG